MVLQTLSVLTLPPTISRGNFVYLGNVQCTSSYRPIFRIYSRGLLINTLTRVPFSLTTRQSFNVIVSQNFFPFMSQTGSFTFSHWRSQYVQHFCPPRQHPSVFIPQHSSIMFTLGQPAVSGLYMLLQPLPPPSTWPPLPQGKPLAY